MKTKPEWKKTAHGCRLEGTQYAIEKIKLLGEKAPKWSLKNGRKRIGIYNTLAGAKRAKISRKGASTATITRKTKTAKKKPTTKNYFPNPKEPATFTVRMDNIRKLEKEIDAVTNDYYQSVKSPARWDAGSMIIIQAKLSYTEGLLDAAKLIGLYSAKEHAEKIKFLKTLSTKIVF